MKSTPVGFESQLVSYLLKEYFGDNVDAFVQRIGYSKKQVEAWCSGHRRPQKPTLRWMLSSTLAPEFKVAAEFAKVELTSVGVISSQLKAALGAHANKAGVYAFYDSMCNVLYIGKASQNLQTEMCQQLKGPLGISFPKAVTKAPTKRWEAVSYVSAYEVPKVEHLDYSKHVESLILRLSKPRGNKVLGRLKKSEPPKDR